MTVEVLESSSGLIIGDGLYKVELQDNLAPEEVSEALNILRWLQGKGEFYGIAGLMLVTGDPRQGKGLFANVFAWKIKRYFKNKRILRDDHPTALFGEYTLFNEDTLREDIARMAEVAMEDVPKQAKSARQKAQLIAQVDQWRTEMGMVLVQNAVALLDEYWKYVYKREPMSPMNRAMGGLNKMWGHTETLYMGVAQTQHDLDRFTCLPWVTHQVRCQMMGERPGTVEAHLYHVRYDRARGKLIQVDKAPVKIIVDGLKERPELGISRIDADGETHYYRYVDIYKSKSAPMMKFGKGITPEDLAELKNKRRFEV